jgi:ABC-2 type transport system permease protein
MNTTLRIARKEFSTALHSVTTYIIFAIFLIVTGVFFSSTVFKIGKADLRSMFNIMHLLFLFYIPALTMGSISKEKTAGTLELLSTMPLRLANVIWGKFLAVMGMVIMAVVFSLVFFAIIVIFGRGIDYGALLCGYLGLITIGAAYTAIGVFASGLQSNQTLSFILALAISAIFYIIQFIYSLVPPGLLRVLQFISFDYHYQNFLKGIIDTRDVLYFASIVLIFMLLAEFNLKSKNMMQER